MYVAKTDLAYTVKCVSYCMAKYPEIYCSLLFFVLNILVFYNPCSTMVLNKDVPSFSCCYEFYDFFLHL